MLHCGQAKHADPEIFKVPCDTAFRNSLNPAEEENLQAYRAVYPQKVFQLSQRILKGRAIVSSERELQTVIKNCGLLWDDAACRWLHPKELLASQGFPVTWESPCVTSCQLPRTTPRTRAGMLERAGNSMNVCCLGALHVYRMCFLELVADSDIALAGRLAM